MVSSLLGKACSWFIVDLQSMMFNSMKLSFISDWGTFIHWERIPFHEDEGRDP